MSRKQHLHITDGYTITADYLCGERSITADSTEVCGRCFAKYQRIIKTLSDEQLEALGLICDDAPASPADEAGEET